MTLTLFDVDPVPTPAPAEPAELLSPDRRRTQRQHDAVAAGVHPLALVYGPSIRVHDDPARSCGNCRFRQLLGYRRRSYPKCTYGNPTLGLDTGRISHGAATDVRRRWPACQQHEYPDGDR